MVLLRAGPIIEKKNQNALAHSLTDGYKEALHQQHFKSQRASRSITKLDRLLCIPVSLRYRRWPLSHVNIHKWSDFSTGHLHISFSNGLLMVIARECTALAKGDCALPSTIAQITSCKSLFVRVRSYHIPEDPDGLMRLLSRSGYWEHVDML